MTDREHREPGRVASELSVEQRYGRRSRQSLEDILDFAADAANLVSRGRKAYGADRILQLAGEAIIGRIGEAVARLSPDLIAHHPEVRFGAAKGMRNFVSHEYDRIDTAVVWVALESDVPGFAAQVGHLLRD